MEVIKIQVDSTTDGFKFIVDTSKFIEKLFEIIGIAKSGIIGLKMVITLLKQVEVKYYKGRDAPTDIDCASDLLINLKNAGTIKIKFFIRDKDNYKFPDVFAINNPLTFSVFGLNKKNYNY